MHSKQSIIKINQNAQQILYSSENGNVGYWATMLELSSHNAYNHDFVGLCSEHQYFIYGIPSIIFVPFIKLMWTVYTQNLNFKDILFFQRRST